MFWITDHWAQQFSSIDNHGHVSRSESINLYVVAIVYLSLIIADCALYDNGFDSVETPCRCELEALGF